MDIGEEKFSNAEPSKELLLTREAEAEEFYDDREYWRSRVHDETGIDILAEDELLDKFSETVNEIYEVVMKQFHFAPCFEIGGLEELSDSGTTRAFSVRSNADEDSCIDIMVSIIINEDMGESSEMIISCQKDAEELFQVNVTCINGEGSEDDDFRMQVDCDSEYNDLGVADFIEKLINYIRDDLNPLLSDLSGLQHEVVTEGAHPPVADFPCEECGKYGISIIESFYPMGKCCYCGCENDIHVCSLCGTVFNEFGGKGDLCNGCLSKDD